MYNLPIPQLPIQYLPKSSGFFTPKAYGTNEAEDVIFGTKETDSVRDYSNDNFMLEEDELAYVATAYNTPEQKPTKDIQQQQICPLDFLIPSGNQEFKPSESKSFVVSMKGRQMKKMEVMAALKEEYMKDSNWDKKRKTELSKKYGVSYSQIYKLHWDWKDKDQRDR